jgi:hypothetical protein
MELRLRLLPLAVLSDAIRDVGDREIPGGGLSRKHSRRGITIYAGQIREESD